MKRLNKNFPNSELNIKLRRMYAFKKAANNTIKDEALKREVLHYCDKQINLYWRRCFMGCRGYSSSSHS